MLTLQELCEANANRQKQWTGGLAIDEVFIALEVVEEAGEVAGALKKIVRHDRSIGGNRQADRGVLLQDLKDEIGDAVINLSRLCNAMGLSMDECVRRKFNETSRKQGIDVTL